MNFSKFIRPYLYIIASLLMILMNAVDSRDNYATHRDSKYRSPGFVQAYVKTYKDANFKWGVRFSKAG
ncbi:hypothetical protein QE152_g9107 [Popillia japonica]|uniref:Uncharacterized protein n=1 Tax=Popillia japonica TaxID=7064 RepID=A0AAW1M0B1_POPJA